MVQQPLAAQITPLAKKRAGMLHSFPDKVTKNPRKVTKNPQFYLTLPVTAAATRLNNHAGKCNL